MSAKDAYVEIERCDLEVAGAFLWDGAALVAALALAVAFSFADTFPFAFTAAAFGFAVAFVSSPS